MILDPCAFLRQREACQVSRTLPELCFEASPWGWINSIDYRYREIVWKLLRAGQSSHHQPGHRRVDEGLSGGT